MKISVREAGSGVFRSMIGARVCTDGKPLRMPRDSMPSVCGVMSTRTAPTSTPAPITNAVANATPVPGTGPTETVAEKPAASNVATMLVKQTKVPLEYQFEGTPGRVVVWVTTDNMASTVVKDGAVKATDLCIAAVADACTAAGIK